MKKKFDVSTLSKVLKYTKKSKFLIFLSIMIALSTVALSLYIPIIIGNTIDLLIGPGIVDFDDVFSLLFKAGIIIVTTGVLQWVMNIINNKVTFRVTKDVRDEAFHKLQSLPLSYLDTHSSGDTVSRIISDVDQFADGLLMGFTQFFSGIATIIGTLVFMLTISPSITALVVVLTPISLFIASFIARKTYAMFHVQSVTRAEQTAIIDEVIGNQKTVKAFSHESEAIKDFEVVNKKLQKCSVKAIFFSSLVNPTTRFVNALVYATVALFGAFAVIKGSHIAFTVGALACFLSYATQYAKPFNEISGVVSELQNSLACASRVFELISEKSEIPDKENAIKLTNPSGNVNLIDVDFSYVEEKPLIKNISVNVKSGQKIAIVGPTGCGKTTLINLLMRFYDVNEGKITVDGVDIRDITRHSLRNNYGMVLQDTWIRNASIRDNIAIGKPNATLEEIIEAGKNSHAHSFIKRLPNGYDTIVSENDSLLSQGQKQLLCIARIMLCLPPMLILDEATSSIDTRTEIKIQKAFAKLMEGRTSFIVAHRLSTIKDADLILVMNDGNIVEQGDHASLLAKNGFYAKLYNSQFEKTEDSLQ